MKDGFVYFISNKHRTTIYIGVTSDIEKRILMHKSGYGSVFTKKYILTDLLWFTDEQIEEYKRMRKNNGMTDDFEGGDPETNSA